MNKEEIKECANNVLESILNVFKKCNIDFNSDPEQGQQLKVKVKEDGVQGKVEINKPTGQKAKVQFEIGAAAEPFQKEIPEEKNIS